MLSFGGKKTPIFDVNVLAGKNQTYKTCVPQVKIKEEKFNPHLDLNPGSLETKPSVMPMSYPDPKLNKIIC